MVNDTKKKEGNDGKVTQLIIPPVLDRMIVMVKAAKGYITKQEAILHMLSKFEETEEGKEFQEILARPKEAQNES